MKNKEKSGLSTFEWILSITGIIVLSCLIILPPVFRIVFKEQPQEYVPDEIEIKALVCTKNNFYSGEVRRNATYTIRYFNDKVRTYTIKNESIYNDPTPYGEEKEKEGRLSTAYNLVEGISYKVNPNDAELKIITEESCDLSKFKSTVVTLPSDSVETKINSAFTTKDSVDQIKIDLQDEGYICK